MKSRYVNFFIMFLIVNSFSVAVVASDIYKQVRDIRQNMNHYATGVRGGYLHTEQLDKKSDELEEYLKDRSLDKKGAAYVRAHGQDFQHAKHQEFDCLTSFESMLCCGASSTNATNEEKMHALERLEVLENLAEYELRKPMKISGTKKNKH